ncbi:HK97-gp10 family putative phage morphogenesis protein [Anaerovibrio sp. JC8]|uniref:HK97-gp10 family putative phage morphogenesis protein n=1 Tax=Anaerovibrio sp. JC8 TaxID=1240085 RepID=UPI001178B9C1|nr:HK97-gp10 family putative phage morphogenesis protein [Anaerovibrio sp. JC8]
MAKSKNISSKALEALGENIQSSVKSTLKDCGEMLVNEAKSRCPVDTGRLRDSIHMEAKAKGTKIQVVADATDNEGRAYGKIVEFSPLINRPFLYPALDALRSEIKDKLIQAVRDGLKGG